MAARLDKNADADLVKASLYFTEAQKQLESFTAAVAKIEAADPEKAAISIVIGIDYVVGKNNKKLYYWAPLNEEAEQALKERDYDA